jgi:DNA-binding CsgD family transcriptional regulator/exonuclease VII small subunit
MVTHQPDRARAEVASLAGELIGRDEELAAIAAFLDGVEGGPRALALCGVPGIGKTVLWETGVAQAGERFGRVLFCRCAQAEASLSFAALSELFGTVAVGASGSLAAPRAHALAVALLLAEPGEERPDAHAIGLAVLDVLRVLAGDGPVVMALDDIQWLDPASGAVLQVALRRLRADRVGLLATWRTGTETAAPLDFEHALSGQRLERRSVGPLGLFGVRRLLQQRLELELTRPELTRLHEVTAGNPFYALELGRELIRTHAKPTARRVVRLPESLRGLLGGRLARLPAETLEVLLHAAALARPTVELVALSFGDRERALAALEVALREGVVEFDDARLRFAHPLLASVCYEQAPVWKRRAVHRALVGAVADVEEQARHLALAADGPDAVAASRLDSAAERAAARGATAAAAELAELAAELTPDDPPLARGRRLRAATFHRLAGSADGAIALLNELLREAGRGGERADILLELALNYLAGAPEAIAYCDEALAEASGDDVRSTRILALRSLYRVIGSDIPAAVLDGRASLAGAERIGDSRLIATAIARLGHAEQYAAEITPGLLERGVEREERLDAALELLDSPRFFLAREQLLRGEIERAREGFEQTAAQAAARGDEFSWMLALWHLCWAEWAAGRLDAALAVADRAQELGGQLHMWHERAWVGRVRALVEADLGLVEEAQASARQAIALGADFSLFTVLSRSVLGRVELALGNIESAGVHLRDLPDSLVALGLNDPALPLWADALELLVLLGETDRARAHIERHEQRSRAIRSPWSAAVSARSRGLLAAAEGDFTAAFAALEQSLSDLNGLQLPLERARTLLTLGVVRRQAQQRRAAREALDQALAIFEQTGARLWADKARAETRRIAGRRSAPDWLTQTEQRVAALAAQGRSNKEIAAELFMGNSTVEMHLTRAYRKLGVRSRGGLAAKLAASRDATA